jgi:uncharacterized integral membrane protein
MTQLVVFLALAFSIVIAIFAVKNTTPVAVTFVTFRADAVAVSVLVLISAALGAAAMLLLGLAREVGLRWRQRSVGQQLKAAQARITELEANQPQSLAQPALSATTVTVPTENEGSSPRPSAQTH